MQILNSASRRVNEKIALTFRLLRDLEENSVTSANSASVWYEYLFS